MVVEALCITLGSSYEPSKSLSIVPRILWLDVYEFYWTVSGAVKFLARMIRTRLSFSCRYHLLARLFTTKFHTTTGNHLIDDVLINSIDTHSNSSLVSSLSFSELNISVHEFWIGFLVVGECCDIRTEPMRFGGCSKNAWKIVVLVWCDLETNSWMMSSDFGSWRLLEIPFPFLLVDAYGAPYFNYSMLYSLLHFSDYYV